MAGLLVGLSVMAVLMSAAMPVWTQAVQREREAELVWRGEQYARALGLFQRKFANSYPPSIDVLVEQKFLRKKYKDPMTGDDFQPIYVTTLQQPSAPQSAGRPGETAQPVTPGGGGLGQVTTPGTGIGIGGAAAGPIVGVVSKSDKASIRLYNGRGHYNEWQFVYIQTQQQVTPGQGVQQPGTTFTPGGPGQQLRPPPIGPGGPRPPGFGAQPPGGNRQPARRPPG